MNFEPQKFYIGLIDFFSVLLPGALLTYLAKGWAGPLILGCEYSKLHGNEAWVIFLFASYVLGHFLFLVGSWLDGIAYAPVREMTDDWQITRLLDARLPDSKALAPKFLRLLARACFKEPADLALIRVSSIKEGYLKRIEAPRDAVNAFQWSKARLALKHPEALATVNRFEADSKFFRSLFPVLCCLLAAALYLRQFGLASVLLISAGLSFWRYMELRFKATQQAYWTILTFEAGEQLPAIVTASAPFRSEETPSGPTHAGGVVFRVRRRETQYLLVQAKKDPRQWVLPKGHIEPGEDVQRTAIREVKEETGVWARIKKELKPIDYALDGKPIKVQFFLMEAVGNGKSEEKCRKHKWFAIVDAKKNASYEESKELLTSANNELSAP